ncbi:MBL fold metallo-hydrolase [Acidaminococcus sp.]|uniref:MBL fold metallo-hydrolase n=1 Tax=Acidaminococcus sp. TaxID=1872103 RepID=UPI003D7DE077
MDLTNFAVAVLASGSRGNSTLIQCGQTSILIDAGISCRRIVQGLRACGLEPGELSGIFLTHEHKDHVAGLEVFAKHYSQVPIFANERTWVQLPVRRLLPRSQVRVIPRSCILGSLQIKSFRIPHDAADPVGYEIFSEKRKCTYLTDCGTITKTVEQAAKGADVMILEANHDETMLRNGPYPIALQRRILGENGHLSNRTAGQFLASLENPPREVFLAHLSEKNNTPERACQTVEDALEGASVTRKIKLYVARQQTLVSNVW